MGLPAFLSQVRSNRHCLNLPRGPCRWPLESCRVVHGPRGAGRGPRSVVPGPGNPARGFRVQAIDAWQ